MGGTMTEHYILFVWGCVEPDVRGPFTTSEERDLKAKDIFEEEGDKHGIFGLDIEDGRPEAFAYSYEFFEGSDDSEIEG